MELSFMVIDDTELDHFIAKKMIRQAGKRFEIRAFYEAISAIDYIKEEGELPNKNVTTLILLDIYMPMMNGYEFLEAFEMLDPAIQDKYYIVALTSSHEPADMNRISSFKSARGILSKPLSAEDLSTTISRMMTVKGIQML